jgi:hypothetical protein
MPDTAWLLLLFVVAVVGTVVFVVLNPQLFFPSKRPYQAAPTDEQPAAPQQANGTTKQQATQSPQTLPLAQWLTLVNDRPDEVPHVGIEGATGTTKTTLAEAIVGNRPGQVVVITAKPDEHEWGGLPFVTIDHDGSFRTAEATLKALLDEVSRRLVAAKRRESVGTWLTVVLDDFTRLRQKCPSAAEFIELVGDQGRSIRVRLILITRSSLVDALGIKGQGDWRDNLVFIKLDRQRRATLVWDSEPYLLDTKRVHELSRRPIPQVRWWSIPEAEEAEQHHLIGRLLSSVYADDLDVPVRAGAGVIHGSAERTGTLSTTGTPLSHAVPLTEEAEEQFAGVPAVLTPEAIRILYSTWGSKNRVAALLTGTKKKRLEVIERALAETEEPANVH